MTLARCAWMTAAAAACLGGCRAAAPARVTPAAAEPALYEDVAARSGIRFNFSHGGSGRHYMIETTGSGCAFFDYDRDGAPDILLLQAGPLPRERTASREPGNRLYHNAGSGVFVDVTAGSGLEDSGYSQGAAIGDVDGDGCDDVFITAVGGNHLFLNEKGTGRFRDVTKRAGLADLAEGSRWDTGAAFGDYDGDGRLDLYVCRYARWSRETDQPCKNPFGMASYCSPEMYKPERHALYHNNGDGTFTDVSRSSGIASRTGRGLGVAWVDYDGDGWEDIFVANDLSPFLLWRNNWDGTFTERGGEAGVAYSDMGQLLSGMGVGVRDYDGDGREDLFVTNFSGQMNALFRNTPDGVFTNVTTPSGVGPASFTRLAFGCEFIDYDRDGRPDLFIGNGHVNEDVASYSQGIDYAEPKSLLRNKGDGSFSEVTTGLGAAALPHVTRGLAAADFDQDGHLDILTNNRDGPPELLRYSGPSRGHWFAVAAEGTRGNRDGYHAKVIIRAGGRTQTAEVRSGSSYLSHSDSRLYFGVGEASVVDEVRIVWYRTGAVTTARALPVDRSYRAVEGKQGLAPAAPRAELEKR